MSMIVTECCSNLIDLDSNSDDVVYIGKQEKPFCADCAIKDQLICPEAWENGESYFPEVK